MSMYGYEPQISIYQVYSNSSLLILLFFSFLKRIRWSLAKSLSSSHSLDPGGTWTSRYQSIAGCCLNVFVLYVPCKLDYGMLNFCSVSLFHPVFAIIPSFPVSPLEIIELLPNHYIWIVVLVKLVFSCIKCLPPSNWYIKIDQTYRGFQVSFG